MSLPASLIKTPYPLRVDSTSRPFAKVTPISAINRRIPAEAFDVCAVCQQFALFFHELQPRQTVHRRPTDVRLRKHNRNVETFNISLCHPREPKWVMRTRRDISPVQFYVPI